MIMKMILVRKTLCNPLHHSQKGHAHHQQQLEHQVAQESRVDQATNRVAANQKVVLEGEQALGAADENRNTMDAFASERILREEQEAANAAAA